MPPPVTAGDRVGVAALSGPIDAESLEAGLEGLRSLGFEPVAADNLGDRVGLFAGDDSVRLDAFHRLAADPSIRAIFFARGGHGALRLMPGIDWELLGQHPRAYVGYSDVTLFLNQIVSRLGWVAFHGPMPAVDLARELSTAERESLLGALAGDFPAHFDVEPVEGSDFEVTGPLTGGCLSLLVSGLGTEFAVPTDGSILFWEDVHEPLYRIDRMLTHLRLSGTLTRIRAMVVGRFERLADDSASIELRDLLKEHEAASDWPIAMGCASGHCEPNLTLPLGLEGHLQSASGRLSIG